MPQLRVANAHLEGFDLAPARSRQHSRAVFASIQQAFMSARKRYEFSADFIGQHLAELRVTTGEFIGPDLLAEVRDLSANVGSQMSIRGTGFITNPPDKVGGAEQQRAEGASPG